ncbi:hypothetical protein OH77DRAFT_493065 [Trametes cingulata]|nr:hypothetical protein OH77DRAFT_493065 [Trametes cingulata]
MRVEAHWHATACARLLAAVPARRLPRLAVARCAREAQTRGSQLCEPEGGVPGRVASGRHIAPLSLRVGGSRSRRQAPTIAYKTHRTCYATPAQRDRDDAWSAHAIPDASNNAPPRPFIRACCLAEGVPGHLLDPSREEQSTTRTVLTDMILPQFRHTREAQMSRCVTTKLRRDAGAGSSLIAYRVRPRSPSLVRDAKPLPDTTNGVMGRQPRPKQVAYRQAPIEVREPVHGPSAAYQRTRSSYASRRDGTARPAGCPPGRPEGLHFANSAHDPHCNRELCTLDGTEWPRTGPRKTARQEFSVANASCGRGFRW